jgi:hypothetical protein
MREQLIKAVNGFTEKDFWIVVGSGHSVWSPEFLVERGFPADWIKGMVFREESGDGKYGLTNNKGEKVDYMDGVYSGAFTRSLAEELGADTTKAQRFSGRGKVAGELADAIAKLPEIEFKEDQSNYGEGA